MFSQLFLHTITRMHYLLNLSSQTQVSMYWKSRSYVIHFRIEFKHWGATRILSIYNQPQRLIIHTTLCEPCKIDVYWTYMYLVNV